MYSNAGVSRAVLYQSSLRLWNKEARLRRPIRRRMVCNRRATVATMTGPAPQYRDKYGPELPPNFVLPIMPETNASEDQETPRDQRSDSISTNDISKKREELSSQLEAMERGKDLEEMDAEPDVFNARAFVQISDQTAEAFTAFNEAIEQKYEAAQALEAAGVAAAAAREKKQKLFAEVKAAGRAATEARAAALAARDKAIALRAEFDSAKEEVEAASKAEELAKTKAEHAQTVVDETQQRKDKVFALLKETQTRKEEVLTPSPSTDEPPRSADTVESTNSPQNPAVITPDDASSKESVKSPTRDAPAEDEKRKAVMSAGAKLYNDLTAAAVDATSAAPVTSSPANTQVDESTAEATNNISVEAAADAAADAVVTTDDAAAANTVVDAAAVNPIDDVVDSHTVVEKSSSEAAHASASDSRKSSSSSTSYRYTPPAKHAAESIYRAPEKKNAPKKVTGGYVPPSQGTKKKNAKPRVASLAKMEKECQELADKQDRAGQPNIEYVVLAKLQNGSKGPATLSDWLPIGYVLLAVKSSNDHEDVDSYLGGHPVANTMAAVLQRRQPELLACAQKVAGGVKKDTQLVYAFEPYDSFEKCQQALKGLAAVDKRSALQELGLEPGAEYSEVRRAYRKLAAELHPDKLRTLNDRAQEEAQERFARVKAAHNLLKDTTSSAQKPSYATLGGSERTGFSGQLSFDLAFLRPASPYAAEKSCVAILPPEFTTPFRIHNIQNSQKK